MLNLFSYAHTKFFYYCWASALTVIGLGKCMSNSFQASSTVRHADRSTLWCIYLNWQLSRHLICQPEQHFATPAWKWDSQHSFWVHEWRRFTWLVHIEVGFQGGDHIIGSGLICSCHTSSNQRSIQGWRLMQDWKTMKSGETGLACFKVMSSEQKLVLSLANSSIMVWQ